MARKKKTTANHEAAAVTELPEGWEYTPLREVTQDVPNVDPRKDPDGEFGYVDISSIDNERFRIVEAKTFKGADAPSRARRPIKPGDVLFSNVRTYLKNIAIVPPQCRAQLCSTGFTVIRPNEAALPEYLFYYTLTDRFVDALTERQTGSSYPAVTDQIVLSSWVPIAPLAEQQRIVTKVRALLERSRGLRDRLAKLPDILHRFRQAVLAAACSGRLTEEWRSTQQAMESGCDFLDQTVGDAARAEVPSDNDPIEPPALPEEWTWSRVESLCDPQRAITYGVIKLGPEVDGGVPTLRSSDVRWLRIEDSHIKTISREIADRYERTYLRGGEVLVTVRGTLGGVAVVPPAMRGLNISREVAMLPILPVVPAEFVCYAIGAPWSQQWLSEQTKGVAYTGVNIRDLKLLPLPIPPREEQQEIIRRVEILLDAANRLQNRLDRLAGCSDRLTQSVLSKAFRGDLVPTEAELARQEGRDYEPASVLLERIKSEREAGAKKKPARKGRKKVAKRKTTTKVETRPLVDVLKESKKRLSPEQLFAAAGFDENSVDDFYAELRLAVQAGRINEERPNNRDVYLKAASK